MIWFVIGALIAYLLATIICGHHEGERLSRSLFFSVGQYYVHIHHWIWALALFVVAAALRVQLVIVYGALLGLVLQGLSYRDWYVVVFAKDRFEEIYARFYP